MASISLETAINAPLERCFDLARSVDLHLGSMAHTNERAVAGVTSGLLELGDEVTWEATHFGIKQRLTVRITAFDRPHRFVDEQVRGAFASLRHIHEFRPAGDGTLMVDFFDYAVPAWWLGVLVDKLVLEQYMRCLLAQRNAYLKQMAELG